MGLGKYKLGELIQIHDERNVELAYGLNDVKGISIQKEFIETKADMSGVSLKPYILVKPAKKSQLHIIIPITHILFLPLI